MIGAVENQPLRLGNRLFIDQCAHDRFQRRFFRAAVLRISFFGRFNHLCQKFRKLLFAGREFLLPKQYAKTPVIALTMVEQIDA